LRNKRIGKTILNKSSRHKQAVKRELSMSEQNTITYGIATISFICGMFFLFPLYNFHPFYKYVDDSLLYVICGIIGIIFGKIVLKRIVYNKELISAKSLAIAGIIFSVIMLIEVPVMPYVHSNLRDKRRRESCVSNQRQISEKIIMYVQDHNGVFPTDKNFWKDSQLDSGVLICPTAGMSYNNAFGYNQELSQRKIDTIRDKTTFVMTADSANKSNLLTGLNDVAFRHRNQAVVSYVDGHVGTVSPETLKSLGQ
jgi:prepilin-type processing-associated H-X9-DG protein